MVGSELRMEEQMEGLEHFSPLPECKGEGDTHFGIKLRYCASYEALRKLAWELAGNARFSPGLGVGAGEVSEPPTWAHTLRGHQKTQ